MKNKDSVIDALFSSDATVVEEGEVDVHVPKKCKTCNNVIICNVLPAAMGFGRVGIKIEIDKCPFYAPATDEKK